MNKLDLSYLDKIKDRIVKGLNECNIMSDISYTANCVEVLKSLEQTKSIAIDNYRKLQTIEQTEPITNDNVTDDSMSPGLMEIMTTKSNGFKFDCNGNIISRWKSTFYFE